MLKEIAAGATVHVVYATIGVSTVVRTARHGLPRLAV